MRMCLDYAYLISHAHCNMLYCFWFFPYGKQSIESKYTPIQRVSYTACFSYKEDSFGINNTMPTFLHSLKKMLSRLWNWDGNAFSVVIPIFLRLHSKNSGFHSYFKLQNLLVYANWNISPLKARSFRFRPIVFHRHESLVHLVM